MKRLVVCCDGTWNKLANPCPTNVVKIAQAVKPTAQDGTAQLIFYEEGVGTQWYDKLPGGAFGWGIDANIKNAYRFLCLNYEPGDEIYLFGFSRGAYTVRSLGGLIHCAGLLTRFNICHADEAYELYRLQNEEERHQKAEAFLRQRESQKVPITLLACWDTVGAMGIPDLLPFSPLNQLINARYQFHNVRLSPLIQNALHAIAIDERRKVFNITPMEKRPEATTQALRQVWFPGGHGCVGGGTEKNRGLSDGTLQWMMAEVAQLGLQLEFDPTRIRINIAPTSDFNNDPGFYRLSGVIDRTLPTDAVLHESVSRRWCARADYRPKNLAAYQKDLDASCQTLA
ncbi:MAG: DUF2235 domain-containing protein (plasmid) [Leptolyngbya sp. BL-A-14]